MILTKCPQCNKQLQVDAQYLGRQGRCTVCQTVFEIREALPDPPGAFQAVEVGQPSYASSPPHPAASEMCVRHPQSPSVGTCRYCGARVCTACSNILSRGRIACPDCYPSFEEVGQKPADPWEPSDGSYSTSAPACGRCAQHPNAQVSSNCSRCYAPVCATCEFTYPDGQVLCPACATTSSRAARHDERDYDYPLGNCANHPAVAAVSECKKCSTPICGTCEFRFPGGLWLCPSCATAPQSGMSSKRKVLLGWSYGLACVATFGIVLVFTGAFAAPVANRAQEEALGVIISLVVFFPSLIGTALGFAALERNLANPPVIWGAVVWNGIILGIIILLMIIGLMMGA